jgi:AcrR family transcriptional regulator
MDRKDRYLDAALKRFANHGFVGTTMDMIVSDVGGSKATLYKQFPSKDALVAGLMDRVSHSIQNVGDALDADQPLEHALTTFGRAVLSGVTSEQAVASLRLCLGEYGRFPELARAVWEHGPAVTYGRFKTFLEQRAQAAELHVDDAQLAAEHFIGGLVGHIQLKIAMGQAAALGEEEIQQRVAAMVQTFLARYAIDSAVKRRRTSTRTRRL